MNRYRLAPLGVSLLLLTLVTSPSLAGDFGDVLKYVPSDAMAVVAVDADHLQKSETLKGLRDGILSEVGADRELGKMTAETGIDAKKDIKKVVFVAGSDFVKNDEEFMVIVQAKFDAKRIDGFLAAQGQEVKKQPAGWYAIGDEAGLLIDGDVIVVGAKKTFDKGLAAKKGKSILSAGSLKGAVSGLKSAKGGFLAVNVPKSLQKEMASEDPEIGAPTVIKATLDASSGLAVSAALTLAAADNASIAATKLAKQRDDFASEPEMARAGLADMMKKLTIAAKGKELNLGIKLSDDDLKKLKNAAMQ